MADRKISELTALTTPASGDYLPIVDISEVAASSKNKRITVQELFSGIPSGTSAAPAIAPEADPSTGIYFPATNEFGIATNGTQRVSVTDSGVAVAGTIGFLQGTGGSVAQVSGRTTGVALNKICGSISLVSASGSTAWQSFVVSNNLVSSGDTIIVNQASGSDQYMIHVTNIVASGFTLTYATTSGTTLESPVFNFSVIKAVSS